MVQGTNLVLFTDIFPAVGSSIFALFCEGFKDSEAAVHLFTSNDDRRAQTSGAEATSMAEEGVKNRCAPP